MDLQRTTSKAQAQKRRLPTPDETDDVFSAPVASHDLTPNNILHLQRTVGNQAVQGLLDTSGAAKSKTPSFAWLGQHSPAVKSTLQRHVHSEDEGDVHHKPKIEGAACCNNEEEHVHHKPKVQGAECAHEEEFEKPKLIQRDPPTTDTTSTGTTAPVTTPTVTPTTAPTTATPLTTPTGPVWDAAKTVVPKFVLDKPAPTRSNTASSTTNAGIPSLPTTFTGHAAVDAGAKQWRYQLDTVESKGKIQIVYFTDNRYPAPTPTDDKGALTNVTKTNYKTIIKDLTDNRTGVPDFWSAYQAEDLHEDYHWKSEWQPLAVKGVQDAEKEIAKLGLGFDKAATAADAEAILKPQATALFDTAIKKARTDWAAMGDDAGDPPYIAQAPAVDALKVRVENEATAKKWDTTP
jgi:hypothetical protein